MVRVLLVDDHAVVRRGMRSILEDCVPNVEVVEAGDGEQALSAIASPAVFDAMVLDLTMPGRSGLDLLAEIKHRHASLPVLIMSLYAEEHFAVRALHAGAAGYLSKSSAPDQLVNALNKVVHGGIYVSEAIADRLAATVRGRPAASAPHERLSDREFDVMRGIASGHAVGEIAVQLKLSVKTVSTYRARLLGKLGLSSNAELTRYALLHGLV